jgi:hypothetical protein
VLSNSWFLCYLAKKKKKIPPASSPAQRTNNPEDYRRKGLYDGGASLMISNITSTTFQVTYLKPSNRAVNFARLLVRGICVNKLMAG